MEDQDQDHSARGAAWGRGEVSGELETALAQYASVEPRSGLEQRVLAKLRGERGAARGGWSRWWLAAAGAFAVAVAMAGAGVVLWNARDRGTTAVGTGSSSQIGAVQTGGAVQHPAIAVEKSGERARSTLGERASRVHRPRPPVAVVAVQPKLEQFPSPRPLSEQEKLLASYVERYPETAELVAKARAAASLRDSLEEAAEASKRSSE
jgi:hypothetical protein